MAELIKSGIITKCRNRRNNDCDALNKITKVIKYEAYFAEHFKSDICENHPQKEQYSALFGL